MEKRSMNAIVNMKFNISWDRTIDYCYYYTEFSFEKAEHVCFVLQECLWVYEWSVFSGLFIDCT